MKVLCITGYSDRPEAETFIGLKRLGRAVSNGIAAAAKLPVKIIAYRGIVANVSFFNPNSWMTYLHPRVDRIICVAEAVRQYFLNMKLFRLKV